MTDIENLRLNWRDEDGSAQFASPLRTAAAVYIAELEAKLKWAMGLNACIEHERAEQAEAELAATMRTLRRCYDDIPGSWTEAHELLSRQEGGKHD